MKFGGLKQHLLSSWFCGPAIWAALSCGVLLVLDNLCSVSLASRLVGREPAGLNSLEWLISTPSGLSSPEGQGAWST